MYKYHVIYIEWVDQTKIRMYGCMYVCIVQTGLAIGLMVHWVTYKIVCYVLNMYIRI